MFSPRCDYSILRFPRDVLISDVGASSRHSTRGGLGSKESGVATSSNEVLSPKYQSLDHSTYLVHRDEGLLLGSAATGAPSAPIFGQSSHKPWQVVIASKH